MTFNSVLYKVSPALHLKACEWYYRVRYGVVVDLMGAAFFIKIAFQVMRGKLMLMDVKYPTSNGGYKYMSLVISKRPVSTSHTYDDI